MGHITWQGLEISIETAKGGTRTAADGSWSVEDFPAHYGRIKGTEGADKDHVDVYVGDAPESPTVFLVDQIDLDGKFDEHKAMVGFPDQQTAMTVYSEAFTDGTGPDRIGAFTPIPVEQFKAWVQGGDTKKPFAYEGPKVPEPVAPPVEPEPVAVEPATPLARLIGRAEAGEEVAVAELRESAKRQIKDALRPYVARGDSIKGFNLGFSIDGGNVHVGMSRAKSGQVVAAFGSFAEGKGVEIKFGLRKLWSEIEKEIQATETEAGAPDVQTVVEPPPEPPAAEAPPQPGATDAEEETGQPEPLPPPQEPQETPPEETGTTEPTEPLTATGEAEAQPESVPKSPETESDQEPGGTGADSESEESAAVSPTRAKPNFVGFHAPQDTDNATVAAVMAVGKQERPSAFVGDRFAGTTAGMFVRDRFPEIAERAQKIVDDTGESIGAKKKDLESMAGSVSSNAPELLPVAAYDEDMAGIDADRPVKIVALRQKDGDLVTIDTAFYDYLVNQHGLTLRQGDNKRVVGAFDGSDLVALVAPRRAPSIVLREAPNLEGAFDVLTGKQAVAYRKQPRGRTAAPRVPSGRKTATIPKGEAENVKRLQAQTLATLDDLRKRAVKDWKAYQDKKDAGADVEEPYYEFDLETARGRKTRYRVKADPKAINELKAKIRKAGRRIFYSRGGRATKPGFEEKARDILRGLRAELDRLGLDGVDLKVARVLEREGEDGAVELANGLYDASVISVAFAGKKKMHQVLRHEVIHALRDLGLFTKAEWATLVKAARASWRAEFNIDSRYQGESEEVKDEEAIAEAFGWFDSDKATFGGRVLRAFNKIRNFFKALAKALRGQGFTSINDIVAEAEEVFENIERQGVDIGDRQLPVEQQPLFDPLPEGAAASKDPPKDRAENMRQGREAMEKAIADQTDVREAMHRPDVGWISFIWGEAGTPNKNLSDGFGIAHLIARREAQGKDGKAIARKMVEVIARGRMGPYYLTSMGQNLRRNVVGAGHTAVLDFVLEGDRVTWVITGFDALRRVAGSGAREISQDEAEKWISDARSRRGMASRKATQEGPSPTRADLGAETGDSVYDAIEMSKAADEIKELFGEDADPDALLKGARADLEKIIPQIPDAKKRPKYSIADSPRGSGGITIEERRDIGDLNPVKRWLYTPQSWMKRWPGLAGLQKFGLRVEMDMSRFIRRLTDEYDAVRRSLSKTQFQNLSDVLFVGDAEETVYTREELTEAGVTDKAVVEAYMKMRKLIESVGRFVDQHRRSMLPKYRARKLAVLRRMAHIRDMDDPTFRGLYNRRMRLRSRLRAGEGDPERLTAQIESVESELHILREETDEYQELARELDRIDAALAQTSIRRRTGYIPHKFFGTWAVYEVREITNEAGEVEESHKLVAGKDGFFPNREAAIKGAAAFARAHPDAELVVRPIQFTFPDSAATALTDASYWRFNKRVGDVLEIRGDELRDTIKGVARRAFRRRIAGFAQQRKGVRGYSKDLDRVLRAHMAEAVRYVMLDKLKYQAISTMENMGLSPHRSANQKNKTLQDAVEAWFRDLNGQKQPMEATIDRALSRPWAKLVWPTLGLGSALLGTTAIAGGPLTAAGVGSYVGYRVYRALRDGGEFKTRALTGRDGRGHGTSQARLVLQRHVGRREPDANLCRDVAGAQGAIHDYGNDALRGGGTDAAHAEAEPPLEVVGARRYRLAVQAHRGAVAHVQARRDARSGLVVHVQQRGEVQPLRRLPRRLSAGDRPRRQRGRGV